MNKLQFLCLTLLISGHALQAMLPQEYMHQLQQEEEFMSQANRFIIEICKCETEEQWLELCKEQSQEIKRRMNILDVKKRMRDAIAANIYLCKTNNDWLQAQNNIQQMVHLWRKKQGELIVELQDSIRRLNEWQQKRAFYLSCINYHQKLGNYLEVAHYEGLYAKDCIFPNDALLHAQNAKNAAAIVEFHVYPAHALVVFLSNDRRK